MPLTLRYKPVSDGNRFIPPVRDLGPIIEDQRLDILAQLSSTHTADEMAEYEKYPAEWLVSMYQNIGKWGVNGDVIANFLEKISDMADGSNADELKRTYFRSEFFMNDNASRINKAIRHLFNSVNENYPFKNNCGMRYYLMKSRITHYEVKGAIEFTSLSDITSSDYKNIFSKVILAISCQDRIGKFGSTFRKKDYDLLTNVWQEYIILPK